MPPPISKKRHPTCGRKPVCYRVNKNQESQIWLYEKCRGYSWTITEAPVTRQ